MTLYHEGDEHSASLLYFCKDYQKGEPPVPQYLLVRTRLLLLSRDVPEAWAERVRGHFGARTCCEIVAPVAALEEKDGSGHGSSARAVSG